MRRVLLPPLLLVAAAAPATAHADDPAVYLSPGYLHSFTWGAAGGSGPGLEITAPFYPDGGEPFGGAPLLQMRHYGESPSWTFGAELLVAAFGLELGYTRRTLEDGDGELQGVHLGPFLSAGYLSVAGRFVIPVSGPAFEAGVCLGVKLPIPLRGELDILPHGFGHGRPLRRDGRPVQASLRLGRRCPRVRVPLGSREELLGAWLADAQAEHASVANFLLLERHLAALGAPEALRREARRAAADETDHARRCFEIASALLGRSITAEPIAVPDTPPPALDALAVESLTEGCLGEGVAAEEMRSALPHAAGPIARHLAVMARDEAEHAALASRVIGWACAAGGERVRATVAAAQGALPVSPVVRPEPDAPAWGRVSPAAQVAAYSAVRDRLVG